MTALLESFELIIIIIIYYCPKLQKSMWHNVKNVCGCVSVNYTNSGYNYIV